MARSKRKPMSDINVVPYIDVMLVLLIIFMVTAPMLTQGIKIDLPQVESAPVIVEQNQEPLIISVDLNGTYYMEMSSLSQDPLELDFLLEKTEGLLSANPQLAVLVRADKNVEYGLVVELMAALRSAGASGVGLITEDL
ncbi:protein TolR [Oleiphilus sp. HI0009]|nr:MULTISPECIES: protein TolR [unclassified Oleiphilus]KZX82144.1 protein TolR [Oleiphilus sp. HI0009]KZY71268.1 protein TolR [Oleiphilus sp. HI0067]KZY72289.1 protein TolR [Oleiphilus sp. HI0066]